MQIKYFPCALAVCLCCSLNTDAQIVTVGKPNKDGTYDIEFEEMQGNTASPNIVHGGSGLYYGVDPLDDQALVTLLFHKAIRVEIGVNREQEKALQRVMNEMRVERRFASLGEAVGSADHTRKMITLANQRERKQELIEELLIPEQLTRLREIARRVELAVVGIDNALIEGFLGRDIGVSEQEADKIRRKTAAVMEQAELEMAEILDKAHKKVLAELSPTKSKLGEELLGKPFFYRIPHVDELPKQSFLEAELEEAIDN